VELSKETVTIASFGMDQFSVLAPTGVDIAELTEYLKKTHICQREFITYSHTLPSKSAGVSYYVFSEKGSWVLAPLTPSISC